MSIATSYSGEVRFVRSNHSSRSGTTITLALPDTDELSKVTGMDGKRYMLALVEIGDDEQPVQPVAPVEKVKGGALAKLAGIWCGEREFWRWASAQVMAPVRNADEAAEFIRVYCGISSRAELDASEDVAGRFQRLIRGPYMKHMATAAFTAQEVPA
jgi:hypothetical protein